MPRRRGAGPQPVAVVDCGTTGVRAFIAEIDGPRQRVLEDLVHPVDLTPSILRGKLDREDMDGVVAAFTAVRRAAAAYGVSHLRAVATSGLREAGNADVLLERLVAETGTEVEVIGGAEESRLYFEALRAQLARCDDRPPGSGLDGKTLLIEIGGGGSSVSLIHGGTLVHSVDEHYGVNRLCQLFAHLRDSDDLVPSIDRYALGAARMILARLPLQGVDRITVTGGVVRRLAGLVEPVAGEPPLRVVPAAAYERWWRRVAPLTPAARADVCACDTDAAAILLPAAALIRHLCTASGATQVVLPWITLRDGLLADLLPGAHGPHHLDDTHLLAEARQLVSRYGGNLAYAENTASLAVQIFDQTRELHGLGNRERTLLEFSALVHDVGSYINVRNRHKHTMYIIRASDIAGLTADEQEMVAHIARYHRKSPPEPHHAEFQRLPRRPRVVVGYLAAILRLAYALDVEREQRIRKVRCQVADGRLLIRVDRRQIALERWSMESKASLFAETFGLPVVVVAREEQ